MERNSKKYKISDTFEGSRDEETDARAREKQIKRQRQTERER